MQVWDLAGVSATRFYTAQEDGRIRMWDTALDYPLLETGPGAAVRSVAVRPDPSVDGLWIALGRVDGTLETLATAEPARNLICDTGLGALHDMQWLGERLFIASEAGHLASFHEGQLLSSPRSDRPLLSVAHDPQGGRVLVGESGGATLVITLGRPNDTLSLPSLGSLAMAWQVSWGPEAQALTACGGAILLSDTRTRQIVWSHRAATMSDRINTAAWCPTSARIAHGHGKQIVLRDPLGALIDTHNAHDSQVQRLCWLTEETLVSVDEAGGLLLWSPGSPPVWILRPEPGS